MIRIVAIEREYGAGGSAIALKLAERLDWKVWDQALTAEIARMARCDQNSVARLEERVDPLFYRLMKVFMRGSYERSLPVNGLEHLDADSMVVFMQRVIEGAAAAGNCVIVGRGAPYLLRGRPDTFHVFVYAPLEEKIRRVRALGKSEAEAVELVGAIDQDRAIFVKKYFGKEWPSRDLYHLMINSKVGDDVVVRTILDEMATLNQASR
ncbi:MAG TPA: cytidylate kinase-like family protein [Bryobacteraceae bacterium]|jgi:cytidylate kinase|nr:cytidylate kinase-like family protein [Bryobacteraceae bacterium]